MVERQYLSPGLPHPESLVSALDPSDNSSIGTTPPASDYPELTPYSTASSFSLPRHCDSSLLTPCSTISSPPGHHNSKLGCHYITHNVSPLLQQPSPPLTSEMYQQWATQYQIPNQQDDTAGANEVFENGAEGRRTPIRNESYRRAFEAQQAHQLDAGEMQQAAATYYYDLSHVDTPNSMLDLECSLPSAPTPIPSQSQLSRHSSTDERADHVKGNSVTTSASRSSTKSPRHSNKTIKKARKPRPSRAGAAAKNKAQVADVANNNTNCFGEEVPPTLKDYCPDEERCIFESRWKHRNKRGQDMWDSIQSDFESKFNKTNAKEMLQMKLKRGRSKYIEWLPRDLEILEEAWKAVEEERYKLILDKFYALGGSHNMLVNASDIEVKLVTELRLEEAIFVDRRDELDIRRRRRLLALRNRSDDGMLIGPPTMGDEIMDIGLQAVSEDEVIRQAHSRRAMKWEDDSSANGDVLMTDTPHHQMILSNGRTSLPNPAVSGSSLFQRRRRH